MMMIGSEMQPQLLVHLDDRSRQMYHGMLSEFCQALSRPNATASIIGGGGMGGCILPQAVRIDGRRRAARIVLLPDGVSISAPATPPSASKHFHVVGRTEDVRRLEDVLPMAAFWRDVLAVDDPQTRLAERRYDESLDLLVRGCIELLYRPWRNAWVLLSRTGNHAINVKLGFGEARSEIYFSARPKHPLVGGMSAELVRTLDAFVAQGTHAFGRQGMPGDAFVSSVEIAADYSFYLMNAGVFMDALRAVRAVPERARLQPAL